MTTLREIKRKEEYRGQNEEKIENEVGNIDSRITRGQGTRVCEN